MRDLIVTVASSAAIIIASYLNFLRFNEYPFLTSEVLLVAAGILLLTVLISLLHQSQNALGRAILEGLLIFFVMDQNVAGIFYSALAGATIIAIVLWRKKSTLPFLGTAAFITLLIGLAGISSAPKNDIRKIALDERNLKSEKLPALLHIILDEHVGIAGLPDDNKRSKAMKVELQDFYMKRGFRLYGRAYSEHLHTVNSIPQMLNFGVSQDPGSNPMDGIQLKRNAYFEFLRKRGYRINVLQSDFLDYCNNENVIGCETYGNASLSTLSQAPISVSQRAEFIAVRFFILSSTAKNFSSIYLYANRSLRKWGIALPNLGLQSDGRISSLTALLAFDSFNQKLENAAAGDAFFMHVLLPHYPYIVTPSCRIKPINNWLLRRSAETRQLREIAYFDQIKCVNKKLDAALVALSDSPANNDFVVIVHGDHGSRITTFDPTAENVGAFSDADLIAGFSTLFAVRAKGVKAGYVDQAAPVSLLLKDFSKKEFLHAPVPPLSSKGSIFLDDVDWQPVSAYSLPQNWLQDGQDRLQE